MENAMLQLFIRVFWCPIVVLLDSFVCYKVTCEMVYVPLDIIFVHTMLIKKSFFFFSLNIRYFFYVSSSHGLLKYFSIEWSHSALANVKQMIYYSFVSEQFNLFLEKKKNTVVTAVELFIRFCVSNISKYLVSVGSPKNYCPTLGCHYFSCHLLT